MLISVKNIFFPSGLKYVQGCISLKKIFRSYVHLFLIVPNNIQLSNEEEVNSGGYIARREASRYISTAFHRP